MTAKLAILSALIICCNGLSIGTVSDKKVNQSETSIGDVFPDWVPFKNKHGDELGEFVPVGKSKIKKRLAAPVNFILRAVAEPESEDYYDKSQGGGDGEDNYESKDWSDLHRPAEAVDNNKQLNHTEISDIDRVVGILTRKQPKSIIDAINNARKINAEMVTDEPDEEESENESSTTEKTTTEEEAYIDEKKEPEINKKEKSSEENVDYDEDNSEKPKLDPSEDVSENEAKKAKILDEVDELKERHAGESRAIAEKVEEEMYKEEFERNRFHPVEETDKYGRRRKYKKIAPDYDEYDDKNASLQDKYKVNPITTETTTQTPKTYAPRRNQIIEPAKLSVFKNPQLYMVYDDSEEEPTVPPKQNTLKPQRFSSRFTSAPSSDEDVRISLVPEDSKEGEPTLFLPKKRKSKKRKIKTTPATDSYRITETVTEKLKQIADTTAADTRVDTAATGNDVTATGNYVTGTDNDVTGADFTAVTGPSAEDTLPNRDDVTDPVPASSDHKKEKAIGDHHSEKGGGKEHDSEFDEEHEEHGKKAYEGHHEDTKTAKGHHDKDNHLGKYEDHGGTDKQHREESGHYGNHNHEEHGKKHAKYEESGKHSKGHSTKGSHDVHKKDEYEKKVEFFEEDGDSAEEEKHGGYNQEKEHSEGGKYKKENLKLGHQHHAKGESGHHEKGGHVRTDKGHKQAAGHDSHGKHGERHLYNSSNDGGKKWIYHHGHPPRTANLVVIDRRGDQWFHGPQYYG